mmetsp:Transcript_59276/g.157752  ORF Transcript_59276/g.157752 Transcript_59276/m.157752 type:complete len:628 (+) Transcript_59276:323-2206(+)
MLMGPEFAPPEDSDAMVALNRARLILGLHLIVAALGCIMQIWTVLSEFWPLDNSTLQSAATMSAVFSGSTHGSTTLLVLRMLFLAASVLSGKYVGTGPVVFAAEVTCLGAMLGSVSSQLSFISTARVTSVAVIVGLLGGTLLPDADRGAVALHQMVGLFPLALLTLAVSALFNYHNRVRWRLNQLLRDERARLQQILSDLIPEDLANKMMKHGRAVPHSALLAPPTNGTGNGAGNAAPGATSDQKKRARRQSLFWGPKNADSEVKPKVPSPPPPVYEKCRVVMMQLDISKFTTLSQGMEPMEVAKLVHTLFSRFDTAVKQLGLFKMDTVGDAYIVAGILPLGPVPAGVAGSVGAIQLPPNGDESGGPGTPKAPLSPGSPGTVAASKAQKARLQANAAKTREVCESILRLSGVVLEALAEMRNQGVHDVHGRIGIALGSALLGALGKLQPRFHMMGKGVRAAEVLEQLGRVDMVHVSENFLTNLGCFGPSPAGAGSNGEAHNGSYIATPNPPTSPKRSPTMRQTKRQSAQRRVSMVTNGVQAVVTTVEGISRRMSMWQTAVAQVRKSSVRQFSAGTGDGDANGDAHSESGSLDSSSTAQARRRSGGQSLTAGGPNAKVACTRPCAHPP